MDTLFSMSYFLISSLPKLGKKGLVTETRNGQEKTNRIWEQSIFLDSCLFCFSLLLAIRSLLSIQKLHRASSLGFYNPPFPLFLQL